MVTASAHACSMGGSQIYLKEGEQMSVEDMIKSVVIASANDAAVALAEHIEGSEEAFIKNFDAIFNA
jgi:D-alanyl-D-alanine carboxypeptidase (penicillin-binding protein 5/6)